MCQQVSCTRKGDLACTIGETRKVLCIEHQAKYREAMNCGGRTVIVHHGVNLDDWSEPFRIRHAAPRIETPTYEIATVVEQLVAEPAPAEQLAIVVSDPDPFPPPTPPTTLRVIMPPTRPVCAWTDCNRDSKQGVCCMVHNDRLRAIYGTAARLTAAQIKAAPEAWEMRIANQAAAKRASMVHDGPPIVQAVVPVVKDVVPVVKDVVPVVKAGPNVPLAIVLLENALKYTGKDARLDALLAAAMVVLQ